MDEQVVEDDERRKCGYRNADRGIANVQANQQIIQLKGSFVAVNGRWGVERGPPV